MRPVFLEFANYAFDYGTQIVAGVSFYDQFYQFICGEIEKEKHRHKKQALVSWLKGKGSEDTAPNISSINDPFGAVKPIYPQVKHFSNIYHKRDHFQTNKLFDEKKYSE